MSKIIVDIGWGQTVCDVKEYILRIVKEFYANFFDDIDSVGKPAFSESVS